MKKKLNIVAAIVVMAKGASQDENSKFIQNNGGSQLWKQETLER